MNALVEILQHGDIREIRMARAPVNALDTSLCNALVTALATAVDEGAEGIVLSGREKLFSAGMDVPHLLSLGDDRQAVVDTWTAFFALARALASSPVPVVAALTGHSPAGGCVLALCCDHRVMARSEDPRKPYVIGLNETQVGLVAPDGIQRLLRRALGPGRAEQLLVTGELVSAERALEIGLVDELADTGEVVARSVEWLQRLLALPRAAVLQTRAIARADVTEALDDRNIGMQGFVEGWYAPDTQAALQAMVARLRR